MIYSVDFLEMSAKINHVVLSKYLKDLGWSEFETKRKDVKVFQLENREHFFQIDVPLDKNFADYKYAMYRAVNTLSEVTGHSVEQVVLELINPISDIIRIHISNPHMDDGSIAIEDAVNLYENAKKLLMATAMDITSPKEIHYGRPDDIIQEFIGNCRFGQTEIGSYVVSVVSPIATVSNGEYEQLSIFCDRDQCANSLTRRVSNKLISSINFVKSSIDDGNFSSETLLCQEDVGCISVNFLEALNNMSLYKSETDLGVSIRWAPTITHNRLPYNQVKISHDYYEPINAYILKYKEEVSAEKTFTGKISALQSAESRERRKKGKVTLVYFVDDEKVAKATATLTESDYEKAIEAHKYGKLVRIRGNLTGTHRKTINNASFEVLNI